MRKVSFIGRQLSANQRQSIETRKQIEQAELQAKQAFTQSINETIASIDKKLTQIEEIEDLYRFKFDRELSFDNRASYCLAHDDDFIDHTKRC